MSTKHDDKIKALLSKVESQKAGLGTKPKASWTTNGIFKYHNSNDYFNLNTVKDTQILVNALATLLEKEQLQNLAAERLGVTSNSFVWDGYSVAEWEGDFKRRVEIIEWEKRKAQLDDTKKKLNSLVSEDAKTEMALADIESLLG